MTSITTAWKTAKKRPSHVTAIVFFEDVENAELNYRSNKVVIEKAAPKTVETTKASQAQRDPDFFDKD